MIDNIQLTNRIATQLKYLPNKKESSYYKVFKNVNIIRQIRVSNHGTYLRTWLDKDYDPYISTNISIAFTKDGVPTNDCLIDNQTNELFKDCTPCIDYQTQTQKPCIPRQVAGISNKKRKFVVKQFVYNCENLTEEDLPLLVDAIKQAAYSGVYNDPFTDSPLKEAKSMLLEPVESIKDSLNPRYNIINENNQINCNRKMKQTIKLTESKLRSMIQEAVNNVLTELDWKTYASAAEKSYEPGPVFQTYSKPNEKPNRNERSRRFMKAAEDALNRDYGYEKEYKSGNKGSLRFWTPHNVSDMDYDDNMRIGRDKADYIAGKDYSDGGRLSYVGPESVWGYNDHKFKEYPDENSSWGYRTGDWMPKSDIYKGDKKFRDAINTADTELRNFRDGNYKYDSIKNGGEGKWKRKR